MLGENIGQRHSQAPANFEHCVQARSSFAVHQKVQHGPRNSGLQRESRVAPFVGFHCRLQERCEFLIEFRGPPLRHLGKVPSPSSQWWIIFLIQSTVHHSGLSYSHENSLHQRNDLHERDSQRCALEMPIKFCAAHPLTCPTRHHLRSSRAASKTVRHALRAREAPSRRCHHAGSSQRRALSQFERAFCHAYSRNVGPRCIRKIERALTREENLAANIAYETAAAAEKTDLAGSIPLYVKVADLGNIAAARRVGELYFYLSKRHNVTSLSQEQALRYLNKAARANDLSALDFLGNLYSHNEESGCEDSPLPKNYAKAEAYYQQAIDKGEGSPGTIGGIEAKLGRMYAAGQGVPRDFAKAEKLLWEGWAYLDLGELYVREARSTQDAAARQALYAKAAKSYENGPTTRRRCSPWETSMPRAWASRRVTRRHASFGKRPQRKATPPRNSRSRVSRSRRSKGPDAGCREGHREGCGGRKPAGAV